MEPTESFTNINDPGMDLAVVHPGARTSQQRGCGMSVIDVLGGT